MRRNETGPYLPPVESVSGSNVLTAAGAKQFIMAPRHEGRFKEAVRRRHDLEQWIRDLESRPPNAGRDALVKRLRAELAAGA